MLNQLLFIFEQLPLKTVIWEYAWSQLLTELQGIKHAHLELLHQISDHYRRRAGDACIAMHEDSATIFDRILYEFTAGLEMLLEILPGDIHCADHSVLEIFREAWVQSCNKLNNMGDALQTQESRQRCKITFFWSMTILLAALMSPMKSPSTI